LLCLAMISSIVSSEIPILKLLLMCVALNMWLNVPVFFQSCEHFCKALRIIQINCTSYLCPEITPNHQNFLYKQNVLFLTLYVQISSITWWDISS
jgi:hypothetical protein